MSAADWTEKADWMRLKNADEATWSPGGKLTSLKLAPELPDAVDEDHPVKPLSAEARARKEVADKRRISLGATGGPVRRLSAED